MNAPRWVREVVMGAVGFLIGLGLAFLAGSIYLYLYPLGELP